MRKEFNWENLINKNIAVHCKTEEEAKDFIKCAYVHGIEWDNFDSEQCYCNKEYINWEDYENKTCYNFANNFIIYNNYDYYRNNNFQILEWSDYTEKEFTINDLRSGYMVELVNSDICLVVAEYGNLKLYNVKDINKVYQYIYLQEFDFNSSYAIAKVYGYRNQTTIEGRKLLWEYKKTEPTTLKCDTENYSITKNGENIIIKKKDSEISVSIPNDDMEELLPMIQELFRKYKTVNKFEKGDTVVVNNKYPCSSYRGERGVVLGYFGKYVWVNLYASNKIISFIPNFLIKV